MSTTNAAAESEATEHRRRLGRFQTNIAQPDEGFCYLAIPKAANTAIKLALLPAIQRDSEELVDGQPILRSIHRKDAGIFSYADTRTIAAGKYDLIFTVVRNSWERIYSCYNDKVKGAKFHEPFSVYGITKDTSFSEFVEVISATDDKHSEIHFRSQWSVLTQGSRFLPNLVLRLESIEDEWDIVRGYFAEKHDIALEPLTVQNRKSKGIDYREAYDERSWALIAERYRKEIKFFGFTS